MNNLTASLLLATLALATACESKTAITGEAATAAKAVHITPEDPADAPTSGAAATATDEANAAPVPAPDSISAAKVADAAAILARPPVPVLCYHQVRDWTPADSKSDRAYVVPVAAFRAQIKMLADSGYHAILPDQLFAYLTTGAPLPGKPVLLTFDGAAGEQFTLARPELDKYGYKALYFVAPGRLGRPQCLSQAQVKQLSDEGNAIGAQPAGQRPDWVAQLDQPTQTLAELTGKKINYVAYPAGPSSPQASQELKKHGFVAAFSLAEERDPQAPLFTIRRIIASGYWSPATLRNSLGQRF